MKFLLFLPLAILMGCTHSIHMVHNDGFGTQGVNLKDARYVKTTTSQDVIFFFAFDTQYVDDARAQLEEKCPGQLSAVSTQFSTSHGFLSWTNKVVMKGICNDA